MAETSETGIHYTERGFLGKLHADFCLKQEVLPESQGHARALTALCVLHFLSPSLQLGYDGLAPARRLGEGFCV